MAMSAADRQLIVRMGGDISDLKQKLSEAGTHIDKTAATVTRAANTQSSAFRSTAQAARDFGQMLSGVAAVASLAARDNEQLRRGLEVFSLTMAGASTATRAFGLALQFASKHPLLAAVTGIIALGSAAVALVRNWDIAKNFLMRILEGLKDSFLGLWDIVAGFFTRDVSRMERGRQQLQQGMIELRGSADVLAEGMKVHVDAMGARWEAMSKSVLGSLGSIEDGLYNFGRNVSATAKKIVVEKDWDFFMKRLPIEAAQAWENMAARWSAAAASIYGALGTIRDRINEVYDAVVKLSTIQAAVGLDVIIDPNLVEQFKGRILDQARTLIGLADEIKKAVGPELAMKFLDRAIAQFDKLGDAGSGAILLILKKLQELGVELSEILGPNIERIEQKIFSLAEHLKEKFGGAAAVMGEIIGKLQGAFEGLFTDILSGARSFGDALSNFFKSLVDSIIAIIARIAAISVINWIFGLKIPLLAKGGIIPGGLTPLMAMQTGGIVNRPTLAMVGEGRQSEAVVPLPDNRSIPVKFTGDDREQREITIPIQLNIVQSPAQIPASAPGMIVATMVDDVNRRGPFFKTIRAAIPR